MADNLAEKSRRRIILNSPHIASGSGSIVTVNDAIKAKLKSCAVDVSPAQSGTGDPSPTNIRPISGWAGANVVVSPTLNAQDGTTYPITWQSQAGTVYGGTLNPLTGVLRVTAINKKFRDMSWHALPSYPKFFYASFTPLYNYHKGNEFKCSMLRNDGVGRSGSYYGPENTFRYWASSAIRTAEIYVRNDTEYASVGDFLTVFGDADFYYELETPLTYQLTPTDIYTIMGANNIWANTGNINSLKYWAHP